jgi:hypothetical protein
MKAKMETKELEKGGSRKAVAPFLYFCGTIKTRHE